MKKHYFYVILVAMMVFTQPAVAKESPLHQVFYSLSAAARGKNTETIKPYVTQASYPMLNRLMRHNINSCLPKTLDYTSERYRGDFVYITASTPYRGQSLSTELAFKQEGGRWKLDLPESFKNGLGGDWQAQLDQIEWMYIALQHQFGAQINCSLVQDMLRHEPASPATIEQ